MDAFLLCHYHWDSDFLPAIRAVTDGKTTDSVESCFTGVYCTQVYRTRKGKWSHPTLVHFCWSWNKNTVMLLMENLLLRESPVSIVHVPREIDIQHCRQNSVEMVEKYLFRYSSLSPKHACSGMHDFVRACTVLHLCAPCFLLQPGSQSWQKLVSQGLVLISHSESTAKKSVRSYLLKWHDALHHSAAKDKSPPLTYRLCSVMHNYRRLYWRVNTFIWNWAFTFELKFSLVNHIICI